MTVSRSAQQHLFETIERQYDTDDAETLKELLMSTSSENFASREDLTAVRADVAELRTDVQGLRAEIIAFKAEIRAEFAEFKAEIRAEFAEFKAEIHEGLGRQTRTYITWMFGLLTAYTAMAGSFVALATIVVR